MHRNEAYARPYPIVVASLSSVSAASSVKAFKPAGFVAASLTASAASRFLPGDLRGQFGALVGDPTGQHIDKAGIGQLVVRYVPDVFQEYLVAMVIEELPTLYPRAILWP